MRETSTQRSSPLGCGPASLPRTHTHARTHRTYHAPVLTLTFEPCVLSPPTCTRCLCLSSLSPSSATAPSIDSVTVFPYVRSPCLCGVAPEQGAATRDDEGEGRRDQVGARDTAGHHGRGEHTAARPGRVRLSSLSLSSPSLPLPHSSPGFVSVAALHAAAHADTAVCRHPDVRTARAEAERKHIQSVRDEQLRAEETARDAEQRRLRYNLPSSCANATVSY